MENASNVIPPNPPRRNWWQRNWKWFVPTGCFTLLLIAASCVALIVTLVFGAMKSSDAYKLAVQRAKADARVQTTLGLPIKEGYFTTGSVSANNGAGNADLSIPLRGAAKNATLYATGVKRSGRWQFTRLVVEVEKTGERIPLVAEETEKDSEE